MVCLFHGEACTGNVAQPHNFRRMAAPVELTREEADAVAEVLRDAAGAYLTGNAPLARAFAKLTQSSRH